jgi:hypothetical protein
MALEHHDGCSRAFITNRAAHATAGEGDWDFRHIQLLLNSDFFQELARVGIFRTALRRFMIETLSLTPRDVQLDGKTPTQLSLFDD